MMTKDFKDLLRAFNASAVKYLIVGARIDGITFDEAWPNRIQGTIDGDVPVSVISREDLIRNKLAGGGEQDLLDVKVLRNAARATEKIEE